MLKEQYREALERIYVSESIQDYLDLYCTKLIDKLLIDQDEANLADLAYIKQYSKKINEEKKLRSYSTSSAQSSYFLNQQNYADNENDLLYNK
jgi:hypothetical protein